MKPLSAKEKKFVAEYLKDANGTQSAIRAGYSKRSACEIAHRLLRKDHIKAAIGGVINRSLDSAGVSVEYVVKALKEVAERCLQRVPVMEFDREEGTMTQKLDGDGNGVWEFDSSGANRSLELLGKHIKMFTDKIEHSGVIGIEDLIVGATQDGSKD